MSAGHEAGINLHLTCAVSCHCVNTTNYTQSSASHLCCAISKSNIYCSLRASHFCPYTRYSSAW